METSGRLYSAVAIALSIIIFGSLLAYGITHFRRDERTVLVKGLAEKVVEANQAVWSIQFNATDDDMKRVYQKVNQSQNILKQFIKSQGFDSENLQILPVTITDNTTSAYNQNTIMKRFRADGRAILTTRDVGRIRQAIQATEQLIEKGLVLTYSDVDFRFTNLNQIKPTMLDEATLNAKKAAETFAKNSNCHISGIKRATQGLFTIKSADQSTSQINPLKIVRVVTTVEYYLG